ncbi:MAG: hypothetical protein Q8Q28_00245 [Pseudomonadota bacterium]|nr:hypothetical protein [Pseudomonadota bacterium]
MLALLVSVLSACGSVEKNRLAGAAAILAGSISPSAEILQTYYLGVFDPTEQIPPTIYRIRVRGQAAFLNTTKFASGWAPASLIDTLSSGVGFAEKESIARVTDKSAANGENLPALFDSLYRDRRFVMFGPEGLRQAPKDHRLVIVMGSSPQAFFSALDESLGEMAATELNADTDHLRRNLLTAWVNASKNKERLGKITK